MQCGEWTAPIAAAAYNDGNSRGECVAGNEDCGSLVLTWYEPDDPIDSVTGYWVALRGEDTATWQNIGRWRHWHDHNIVPSLRGQQRQTALADKPTADAATGGDNGNSVTRVGAGPVAETAPAAAGPEPAGAG